MFTVGNYDVPYTSLPHEGIKFVSQIKVFERSTN